MLMRAPVIADIEKRVHEEDLRKYDGNLVFSGMCHNVPGVLIGFLPDLVYRNLTFITTLVLFLIWHFKNLAITSFALVPHRFRAYKPFGTVTIQALVYLRPC